MVVADILTDRIEEQDITLLTYVSIGDENRTSWGDFVRSFGEYEHGAIWDRLAHLTLKDYLFHNTGRDGYSERSETWTLTAKGKYICDNYERTIRAGEKEGQRQEFQYTV